MDTTTPTTTAMARSVTTVTAETRISTNVSDRGMRCMIRRLDQAKVPMTTMNITPDQRGQGNHLDQARSEQDEHQQEHRGRDGGHAGAAAGFEVDHALADHRAAAHAAEETR